MTTYLFIHFYCSHFQWLSVPFCFWFFMCTKKLQFNEQLYEIHLEYTKQRSNVWICITSTGNKLSHKTCCFYPFPATRHGVTIDTRNTGYCVGSIFLHVGGFQAFLRFSILIIIIIVMSTLLSHYLSGLHHLTALYSYPGHRLVQLISSK